MIDEELKSLENLSSHFAERKKRAKARLAEAIGRYWYFAILGLRTNVEEFSFASFGKLRRVIEPPGEIELAAALKIKSLFTAISRYSHNINYELAIDREFGSGDDEAFTLAWWIISALRVKTQTELLIPAVSDYSWSTIAGVDGDCHAQLIEDVPQARARSAPIEITESDLQWVLHNLTTFGRLLEVPKFRLAVTSLTTHHLENSDRMMVATLWVGIEALFEVQSELRYRISALAASVLEVRGQGRYDLYKRIKKLYDVRSKAVHGSPISGEKINEHILEVRGLLSRLVCKVVELGEVPNEEAFEKLMLC